MTVCIVLLFPGGLIFYLKWQIFLLLFHLHRKCQIIMYHFHFTIVTNPFMKSVTIELIPEVTSWFWIDKYFNLLPLLRRLLASVLNPGDFTIVFLRLIQLRPQITFNCMHLFRGIIESWNQKLEGTWIKVGICLYNRAKVYRFRAEVVRCLSPPEPRLSPRTVYRYSRIHTPWGVRFLHLYLNPAPSIWDSIFPSYSVWIIHGYNGKWSNQN